MTRASPPGKHTATAPLQPLGRYLLQVYNLFDDILLLAEGHIVYFGPKEEVRVPSGLEHAMSNGLQASLQYRPMAEESIKCLLAI